MEKPGESTVVPRLRFPEFLDSAPWDEKAIKAVCEINPANDGLPESFIYIDLESVNGGVLKARRRIEKRNAPDRAQRLLKDGDVVFQIVRPYQRNNLLFRFVDGETYVASTGYAQLRAKESGAYLFQVIHTDKFVERVLAKCTGSSYPAINSSDLADVALPMPPTVREQQKIADCLMSLDEVIAAQGRKVAALKTYKRGLMQQLFPREGETLPRLRFPEFRNRPAWTLRKVGDLLGEISRPINMGDDLQYSLVTVKRRYGGVVSRERLRGRAIKVKSQFAVRASDFLISKRQIVHNACGIVPAELDGSIVSNEYAVLGPSSGCDIEFFNYFAQQPAVSASFLNSSVGIVIEKMLFKLSTWLKHEFLFPELDEQQRISSFLASVEEDVNVESKKTERLVEHKKGLMQRLFPASRDT